MSNFHPLEVVDRGSETQLQVSENKKNKKRLGGQRFSTAVGHQPCSLGTDVIHLASLQISFTYTMMVKRSKQYTFVYYLCNVGPASKTLGWRCMNVVQMFCVYWEVQQAERRWPLWGLMLDQRRRQWPNVKPTWFSHIVFSGLSTAHYFGDNQMSR